MQIQPALRLTEFWLRTYRFSCRYLSAPILTGGDVLLGQRAVVLSATWLKWPTYHAVSDDRYHVLRISTACSGLVMSRSTQMALTVRKRAFSDPCAFTCTYFSRCGSQQTDHFCPRCHRLICARCERKRLRRTTGYCGHRCERPRPSTLSEPTEWGPADADAALASASSSSGPVSRSNGGISSTSAQQYWSSGESS